MPKKPVPVAAVVPKRGDVPARALTPADIRPVALAIEAGGHHEIARRALAQISRVMRHTVALGLAERDVLAPAQSEKYATLTKPAEIAELMRAIYSYSSYSGDPSTCYCLRILPLVFTRPGELRNARWPAGPSSTWTHPSPCGGFQVSA